jgi:Protein of unknown function (DUF2892)
MTSWQLVRLVAGSFILLSLALGIPGSPIFVSPWFLAFTAFVGVNLLQSAVTRWCLSAPGAEPSTASPMNGCVTHRCAGAAMRS